MQEPTLDDLEKLARQAGAIAYHARNKHATVSVNYKGSVSDLVTETDVEVEKYLQREISRIWPNHHFLCEESSKRFQELTDAPTWVIDPIDGTANFVMNLPLYTISIAFCINKAPILGVVYNPTLNQLVSAEKGVGVLWDGLPLPRPEPKKMRNAIVATGFCVGLVSKMKNLASEGKIPWSQADEMREIVIKNVSSILDNCQDIRRLGACSWDMCLTAKGAVDAFVELGVKEWDVAAATLILREAGGFVCNFRGEDVGNMGGRNFIGATSEELARDLSKLMKLPSFDTREFE